MLRRLWCSLVGHHFVHRRVYRCPDCDVYVRQTECSRCSLIREEVT